MSTMDIEGVTRVALAWDPSREADRKACAAGFESFAAGLEAAMDVWREAGRETHGEPDRFRFVVWFGAERAKRLHGIQLAQRERAVDLARTIGLQFADSMGLDPSIDVASAYDQLGPQETGAERIENAIHAMQGRRDALLQAASAMGDQGAVAG